MTQPQAVFGAMHYLEQVRHGMYVRAALIEGLLADAADDPYP